jgi:hypothetical protein
MNIICCTPFESTREQERRDGENLRSCALPAAAGEAGAQARIAIP